MRSTTPHLPSRHAVIPRPPAHNCGPPPGWRTRRSAGPRRSRPGPDGRARRPSTLRATLRRTHRPPRSCRPPRRAAPRPVASYRAVSTVAPRLPFVSSTTAGPRSSRTARGLVRRPVRIEVGEVLLARLDDVGQTQDIAQAIAVDASASRTASVAAVRVDEHQRLRPRLANERRDRARLRLDRQRRVRRHGAPPPDPASPHGPPRAGARPSRSPRCRSDSWPFALAVDLDSSERRRVVGRDDPVEASRPTPRASPRRALPVPVARQPADEHRPQPEPPERSGRVERAALRDAASCRLRARARSRRSPRRRPLSRARLAESRR